MKRCLLLILAVLLLLVGCTGDKPEQTQPPVTTKPAETQVLPTVPNLRDAENPAESRTDGALMAFRLPDADADLAFMGEQLLLFCNDGQANTRMLRLEAGTYGLEHDFTLEGIVYPGPLGFRATAGNLAYYSEPENAVILLDAMLREVSRAPMPEDMETLPLISADMQHVWYVAGTQLRVMDLESSISRPLRQRDCQWLSLRQSLFDDRVLVCDVGLMDGSSTTEFLSSETGETLGADSGFGMLAHFEESFFLERSEGVSTEYLYGKEGETVRVFLPREDTTELACTLALKGVVGLSWDAGTGTRLRLYDLESGGSVSSVPAPGLTNLRELTGDAAGRYIWFLADDESGSTGLYRWDTEATRKQDDAVYTAERFTRENPDTEGLVRCRAIADRLEETYGIRLHLQEDVPPVADYSYGYEFHPANFEVALEQLEETLSQFPEDFFRTLGSVSDDGKVHIGLVRSLTGKTGNAIPGATGVQYWYEGNVCMTLKISTSLSGAMYHELSHVMDTFILNEALDYDDWDDVNPRGFRYDGNYTDYLTREDLSLTEGENRAFLNSYSMSYPKEDRAEIFAAAMDPDAGYLFTSPILQEKLIRICKGIRDAFGLKKDTRAFPWEQHLEKSLAYVKKK